MSIPNEHADRKRPEGPDAFSADDTPPTQSQGALVPPPRKPPTAVSADADSSFPFNPRRFRDAWRQPGWQGKSRVARLATEFFDALDEAADRIAERLKLRS
ncbi:MAG TPA: hypothetical protein VGH98_08560 [Gemmatimonadaceae bacterium]